MFDFKTTQVLGLHVPIHKFKDEDIHRVVTTNPLATAAMVANTSIIFICRENLKDYKNDDWMAKGTAYHAIVVPYQEVLDMDTPAVTALCAALVVERLLQMADKNRKKIARLQAKAAA